MPGYRPPSTEPRGKWAKRIHEKRRADGISQTAAFELLGKQLGFGPKSRFSYVALDMGTREPTDAEAKVLAEWLGGYPEDGPAEKPAPADQTGLIEALTRQAEATEALTYRLDLLLFGRRAPRTPEAEAALEEVYRIIDEQAAQPETSGEAGLVEGERRGPQSPNEPGPDTPPRSPRRRPLDAEAGRG